MRNLEVSVLDSMGEEVTGIVWPVALCMTITMTLVEILNPDGGEQQVMNGNASHVHFTFLTTPWHSDSNSMAVYIASAAYDENEHVGEMLIRLMQIQQLFFLLTARCIMGPEAVWCFPKCCHICNHCHCNDFFLGSPLQV
jgi:hypothetical protein